MGSDSLTKTQHFVGKNKLSISAPWKHMKPERDRDRDGETETERDREDMLTSLSPSLWAKVLRWPVFAKEGRFAPGLHFAKFLT